MGTLSTTYTANFTTQYQLTTSVSPAGSGTITPATAWFNAGTTQSVNATANSGYQFAGFTGALTGATTPQSLTMSGPATVTANFTGGSGGGNLITNYSYDLLGHLTQVSMPRATGTQTRTFYYSGNYLVSATNPENGTVVYTYNNDGLIATKIDAKGQLMSYAYDSYKRLSEVRRYMGAVQPIRVKAGATAPFVDTTFGKAVGRGLRICQWLDLHRQRQP